MFSWGETNVGIQYLESEILALFRPLKTFLSFQIRKMPFKIQTTAVQHAKEKYFDLSPTI